tara:strand:+ start:89 stop:562 length:474 start_codon:yes stop_codon:yes gene_type:complete
MISVNKNKAKAANVGGRGGKENMVLSLFNENLKRVSKPLYDAVSPNGDKIEFKKQADDQWFDLPKYYNLSDKDKKIIMTFIMHKSGKVVKIAVVSLGEMLTRLIDNPKYSEYGWTSDAMETLHLLKQKSPKIQSKIKLKTRSFLEDNSDIVKVIYNE